MAKIFTGIDEAGLGPVLGPYCCTAVSIRNDSDRELFDIFKGFNELQIGDSKKIYSSGKTPAPLELTALSFLYQAQGFIPENLGELLRILTGCKENVEELFSIPWYNRSGDMAIPAFTTREQVGSVKEELERLLVENSLSVEKVRSLVVPAVRFNGLLDKGLNKSEVCQEILSPLLLDFMTEDTRITVDRQGGRRYYGEWLLRLFPGKKMSIRRETQDLSVYEVDNSTIRFQVKGDDLFMETALASIFSKYLRELLMMNFNRYWTNLSPELKPTAGYPLDGKRFIADLNRLNLTYSEKVLVRQK